MLKHINLNVSAMMLFAVFAMVGLVPMDADAALVSMVMVGNTASVLAELRQDRGAAINAARVLNDAALKAKRPMTAEEEAKYNEHMDTQANLEASIKRTETMEALDRDMADIVAAQKPAAGTVVAAGTDAAMSLHMQAFTQALLNARHDLTPELKNALNTTTTAAGAALVAPQEFVAELIKAVDDATFIRGLANVMTISGTDSLGQPSLDNDPSDADWTSELQTGSEDSTMSFGARELTPHPLAKRIKVSNTLINRSAIPIEQIVRERLAYKFAVTEEKAFLTGTGANQPLGVFTASADGISTARDVATAGASAIVGDDLKNLKYSLKGQYQKTAQWIMHRNVVKAVAKLKGVDNQYIWREGLTGGEPDRLLDMPVNMSEFAPGIITTGLYTAILGDFSKYYVVEEASYSLQRLGELYAETNETGYIARTHIDGMPVLEEAFARLKQA